MECLPIQSQIYIPENKLSAWVYKKGVNVTNDKSKEYQGEWVVDGYTLDKKKVSTEVWIFRDNDKLGIDRRVLENNPLQGLWGYAPNVDPRKAVSKDMWFFPPKSAMCKIPGGIQEYSHEGTWVKPTFKQDFSKLSSNSTGFLNVSGDMKISKGERHSVAGKWNMLGFNDDIVRGSKKKKNKEEGNKGPWEIFVVKQPSGERFLIKSTIPGNKIAQIKTKIHREKAIPVEEQRLSFNGVPLQDKKTIVGSGIRNGDTIELNCAMIIYVQPFGKEPKIILNVEPIDSLKSVKGKVKNRIKKRVIDQILYFQEEEMIDNNKSLQSYRVNHLDTLFMGEDITKRMNRPKEEPNKMPTERESTERKPIIQQQDPERMKHQAINEIDPDIVIFIIKEWNNYKFKLRVKRTNTILVVKQMIESSEDIPVKEQRLTFKKKSVYNTKTLEVSKIRDKSILHLGEPKKLNAKASRDINVELPDEPKIQITQNSPPVYKPIEASSPLVPKLQPAPERFEVQTKEGRSFHFDFDPNGDSFGDLKRKIGAAVGLPVKDLHLLDSSDEIVDDNSTPAAGAVYDVAPQIEDPLPPDKVKLSGLPNTTMKDLEDVVEKKPEIPKTEQRVFFLDNESNALDNITPMKKVKIGKGSVLEVQPLSPVQNEITVRSPDGRSFILVVDPTDDMDNIKMKIANEIGVPAKELPPLLLNNEELDNNYRPSKNDILDITPLEIEVELPDRTRIVLSVLPTQKIGEIKEIIEDKTGVEKSDQRVFFFDNADEEIDDDLPLTKTKMQPGTCLKIRTPESKEPENITIKDPTGRMFQFVIDPNEPIKEVKRRMTEKIGIPLGGLKLDDKEWDGVDDEIALDDTGFTVRNGGVLEVAVPELEIALPNLKKIKLQILPTMTIRDVKKLIEEEAPDISIKDTKQRMFFLDNAEELDNDTPFEKIKFEHGQTIELRSMSINVQHWNGDVFKIDAQTDWYIEDIRERIFELTNISRGQQNISCNGEPVKEELQLMKQGIVHNSLLDLEPMSIRVNVPSRKKPVRVVVNPTDSVRKIKRLALKKPKEDKNRSIRDYCLVIGDQELDDDEVLEKFEIQHDDLLTLEKFKLHIMHWSGKITDLDGVKRHNTNIASLKERIHQMEGIPVKEQRLSLYGKRLEDKNTMEEVKHKAILVLEPLDAVNNVLKAEKKTLKKMKSKKIKLNGDYNEIMPVMPDWKRRIFFFDNDDKFDAHIDLSVMHWTGEIFLLDNILPKTKVAEIKSKIFIHKGVEKKKQKLMFDGEVLDEKKTLREQSVGHKSILVLVSPTENSIAAPTVDKLSGIFEMLPAKLVQNINLIVEHWNGDTFKITPSPNDYIDDVKDKICEITNIPLEQVRLLFEGMLALDDKNLIEQNIIDGSVLALEPMRIFLELPAKNELVPINVEPHHTLYDVKKMIIVKMTTCCVLDSLCVMFGGDELDNTNTLFDYGIEHEDTLRIEIFQIKILQLSGEMFSLNCVGPNDTTYDVKKNIAGLKSIPLEEQILSLKRQVLNDVLRLKDQGVKHRAVVMLDRRQEKNTIPLKEKVSFTLFASATDRDKGGNATFSIKIQHWNGETFSMDAEPTEYIDDVKERIFSSKNILINHQLLEYEGQPVKEGTSLGEQGITDNSTLVMRKMKLYIDDCIRGSRIDVEIEPTDTVQQIKKLYQKRTKTPTKYQIIVMDTGEELSDSTAIAHYGIDDGDTLGLEPFKVRIIDGDGQLCEVDGIHCGNTTDELKIRISELKSITPSEQKLTMNGEVLINMLRLKDQGIKHMSIIVLDLHSGSSHSLADERATTRNSKASKKMKSNKKNNSSSKVSTSTEKSSKEKKKKKDKTIKTKNLSKKSKKKSTVGVT